MKLCKKLACAMAWVSFIFIAMAGTATEPGKTYDLPLRFIARFGRSKPSPI